MAGNSSLAGEYLEPEDANFADYQSAVRAVLKDAFEPNVRARAIAEPSFFPEFAVGVKEDPGRYSVFYLEPSEQVWQYTTIELMKKGQIVVQKPDGTSGTADEITRLEKSLPPKPTDVKVERCAMPIEPKMGVAIVDVWYEVLSRVKPQPPTNGLDGEFTHFSMTVDGHELAGQTWSPPEHSEAGRMTAIVYAIRSACKAHDKRQLTKIYEIVAELQRH